MRQFKVGYTFDDVLLIPRHSSISSRSEVKLSTNLGNLKLKLPILSSNMDTVTEGLMAATIGQIGGAGVLHRFGSSGDQWNWAKMAKDVGAPIILSVGLDLSLIRFYQEVENQFGLDGLCVDVAHGDHSRVVEIIKIIRKEMPVVNIIAGNVATGDGALRLCEAGANVIKVGIGPGSVCSTRIMTGHGVPQLSAIIDVVEKTRLLGGNLPSIIADGGIRTPGDIVKALAAGANAVMLGSLLAGTQESPGDIILHDGQAYKSYRGMASYDVQKEKRADRAPQVEGVSAKVPYKGPVALIINHLTNGIRSGFSYSGANNIRELQANAEFMIVTANGVKESAPHHPSRLSS